MSTKTENPNTTTVASTGYLQKLKLKWELESTMQVLLVLLVFSLTGSTVVFLRKALFDVLGFDASTAFWLKTVTYILFILPAYQIMLLVYGFIFGQFTFFWNKEKKMFNRIKKLFVKK